MATIKRFEEINAWQTARELTNLVYSFTAQDKFSLHYRTNAKNSTAKTPRKPGFQVFPGALSGKKSKMYGRKKRQKFASFAPFDAKKRPPASKIPKGTSLPYKRKKFSRPNAWQAQISSFSWRTER